MENYAAIVKGGKSISVCLYIEDEKIMAIGEKMNAINEEAYMNGYNWEAFFDYYLKKYHPDILTDMNTDPEADMYSAYYPLTLENEQRAKRFAEIIGSLIEKEEELYRIVREESDEIQWD